MARKYSCVCDEFFSSNRHKWKFSPGKFQFLCFCFPFLLLASSLLIRALLRTQISVLCRRRRTTVTSYNLCLPTKQCFSYLKKYVFYNMFLLSLLYLSLFAREKKIEKQCYHKSISQNPLTNYNKCSNCSVSQQPLANALFRFCEFYSIVTVNLWQYQRKIKEILLNE